jgi:hypothetical protein
MPSKKSSKPSVSPPKYAGRNRYTYVINAELKTDKDVFVHREKWKDRHFHVAARDSKGHFIATKRWSEKTRIHTFENKYKNPARTLTIDSTKKYNMDSKRNRSMLFKKAREKYGKYPFRQESFSYRFMYDSNTGKRL